MIAWPRSKGVASGIVFAIWLSNATAAQEVNPLPQGWVGHYYKAKAGNDNGATAPLNWRVVSGVLPSGLVLDGGVITGIPTESNTYQFQIVVTDSSQPPKTTAASYVLRIEKKEPLVSPPPLPVECLKDIEACLSKSRKVQCDQDEAIALASLADCKSKHPNNPSVCKPFELRIASPCPQGGEIDGTPRPVEVVWIGHPTYPLSGRLILDDLDPDQHMWMSVCAVSLYDKRNNQMLGTFPGKLLNNNCNVAYGGWGTEFHEFYFAVLTRADGYWAPPNGNTADMLAVSGFKGIPILAPGELPKPGWNDSNRTKMIVCRANFTREEGPVSIWGFRPIRSDVEHGKHVGYLLGDGCHFEWGGGEQVSNRYVEVYYLLAVQHAVPPAVHKPEEPAPPPAQPTHCSISAHLAACGPAGILPFQDLGCSVTCNDPKHPAYCVPDSCTSDSYIRELCVCRE